MNKKNITKIINKELTILQDITQGFAEDTDIHPIEIELALSKTTDIFNLLSLLKDNNKAVELISIPQEQKKPEATQENKAELVKEEIIDTKKEKGREEPKIEEKTETEEVEIEETIELEPIEAEPATESMEPEIESFEQIPEPIEEEEEEEEEVLNEAEEEISFGEAKDEEETNEIADTKEIPKNGILADQFKEQTISVNDMLSSFKKDKNLAALLKDRPVTDLKKAVKINDRIWYIKELFENNADYYNSTIEKLNQLNNLDEALSYVFIEFNWDQSKKSTISFLELIYRRFALINE